VDYSLGMPENPMPHTEIERKFMSLASAAVGAEKAGEILVLANGAFKAKSMAPLSKALTEVTVRELAVEEAAAAA
jgi:hypothetical protein